MPYEAPKKQVLAQKLGEFFGGGKLDGDRAKLEHNAPDWEQVEAG